MSELKGKRALVTGGAKGIGVGIAEALAEAGADLLLHFRSDPNEAENVANSLRRHGGKVFLYQADLGTESGVDKLFSEVDRVFGGLDIAVNNAGWDPGYIAPEEINYELYHKLSDMNIKGTLFCCLNELKRMRSNVSGGCIINIGSVQMDTTVPGRALYAMSKGAIHSLTGQLALEGGPHGVRVNNIAPGYIEVERMSASPEFDRDDIASGIPIRRLGVPRDIGNTVVFLASEKASFLTGQTLIVDGGVSRKLARSSK